MTEPRKRLSIRISEKPSEQRGVDAQALLAQAIEHLLCVRWSYNRTLMIAAPELLYQRNDSLYCDAVVIERNGATVTERKLATFKLTGLTAITLTTEGFTPMLNADLADPRYAGGITARVSP